MVNMNRWEWQAPPDWPAPPPGWSPPPGWRPDPSWPPVPEGWNWWRRARRMRGKLLGLGTDPSLWRDSHNKDRAPRTGTRRLATTPEDRAGRVWRVRLWVRLLAVAAPLAALSTLLYPQAFNPDWTHGLPRDQWAALAAMVGVLVLAAWSALQSRVVLQGEHLRVVNPWGAKDLLTSEVLEVRPGPYGVEFVLSGGRCVKGFAVQCTYVIVGPEPRWVGVARAVTGRDPIWRVPED